MRNFDVSDEHEVPENIRDLIEKSFGRCESVEQGVFIVEDPNFSVIKEVRVEVEESCINLGIEEVSVEQLKESGLLDQVPEVVKSKNEFLRLATGKTVEDRKSELRSDVIDSELVVDNPTPET